MLTLCAEVFDDPDVADIDDNTAHDNFIEEHVVSRL